MSSTTCKPQSIEPKARATIFGHGRGWVFTPKDLVHLGDPRSVGMALTRLTRKGVIRQLARGLYDFPVEHPVLGRIAPSADAIAKALAARDAVRLQPAGAYAANMLGLSDQVPTKVVFLTDGPSRRVQVGQREIVLQRTTPRNMATAGVARPGPEVLGLLSARGPDGGRLRGPDGRSAMPAQQQGP